MGVLASIWWALSALSSLRFLLLASSCSNCCIFNSSYSELGSQLVAAIETIHADNSKTSTCFNLMGQRCDDHSHGFIVIDGKLILR